MGEVLHKVDFDQLEIENKQYLEKIDQRNTDLLALKLMSTRTNGVLIKYKVLLVSEKEKAKKNSKNLSTWYLAEDSETIYTYVVLEIIFIQC